MQKKQTNLGEDAAANAVTRLQSKPGRAAAEDHDDAVACLLSFWPSSIDHVAALFRPNEGRSCLPFFDAVEITRRGCKEAAITDAMADRYARSVCMNALDQAHGICRAGAVDAAVEILTQLRRQICGFLSELALPKPAVNPSGTGRELESLSGDGDLRLLWAEVAAADLVPGLFEDLVARVARQVETPTGPCVGFDLHGAPQWAVPELARALCAEIVNRRLPRAVTIRSLHNVAVQVSDELRRWCNMAEAFEQGYVQKPANGLKPIPTRELAQAYQVAVGQLYATAMQPVDDGTA